MSAVIRAMNAWCLETSKGRKRLRVADCLSSQGLKLVGRQNLGFSVLRFRVSS